MAEKHTVISQEAWILSVNMEESIWLSSHASVCRDRFSFWLKDSIH